MSRRPSGAKDCQHQHGCAHCAAAAASSPSCECLPRVPPPGLPAHLPMAPSPSNIAEMRAWLLDRYASSSFNKWTHQPLPRMDGPPVEIHLIQDAVSTPATIPLHWQDQVKADLDSDVALDSVVIIARQLVYLTHVLHDLLELDLVSRVFVSKTPYLRTILDVSGHCIHFHIWIIDSCRQNALPSNCK